MGGRWAVLAVWVAASGCVVTVGDKPTPPPEGVPAVAPASSEFGVMRPGDFVPANPTLVAEVPPRPADPPPIPVPSLSPPTHTVSTPVPPDSPIVTAARHLDADRPEAAGEVGLPPGVLSLLSSAVQASRAAGPSGVGEVVRQLDAAAAGLAAQAPLEVTRAVLCGDVKGFAKYDPLPERPVLPAGKRPTVWVYLELRNVVAQPDGPDRFVVRLNRSLVVRDAAGAVVDQYAEPADPLVLRSPRRDNFAALWFRAPERPGEYTVTMRVQEPASAGRGVAREASKLLRFTVK